jgi:hypothetical protein
MYLSVPLSSDKHTDSCAFDRCRKKQKETKRIDVFYFFSRFCIFRIYFFPDFYFLDFFYFTFPESLTYSTSFILLFLFLTLKYVQKYSFYYIKKKYAIWYENVKVLLCMCIDETSCVLQLLCYY